MDLYISDQYYRVSLPHHLFDQIEKQSHNDRYMKCMHGHDISVRVKPYQTKQGYNTYHVEFKAMK